MWNENIETVNVELHMYAIAISDILELGCTMITAATNYKLDIDYLSMFIHTIHSKGKVIKGKNKNYTHLDELAFLLYIKMCPQEHCVCLACFEEYLPRLMYKFAKRNNLNYPTFWDTYQKADEFAKMKFLERNRNEISRLFSKDCLRLSPNNVLKKSLFFDEDVHECLPSYSRVILDTYDCTQNADTSIPRSSIISKYNLNIIIAKYN